jgi:hypothetical protein
MRDLKSDPTCCVIKEEGDVSVGGQKVFVFPQGQNSVGYRSFSARNKLQVRFEVDDLFVYCCLKIIISLLTGIKNLI